MPGGTGSSGYSYLSWSSEKVQALAISIVRAMASGKWVNSRAISAGGFQMPLGIDGKPQAGLAMVHFSRMQVTHVGERPALRHVVGHVVDGNERRADALAELGQQAEPARLVAAMIMHAGKEGAARRGVGQGGETGGKDKISVTLRRERSEPRRAIVPGVCGCASFGGPRCARAPQDDVSIFNRRQRDQHLAFACGTISLEGQMAFAFLGGEIARGEQFAEPAIGGRSVG